MIVLYAVAALAEAAPGTGGAGDGGAEFASDLGVSVLAEGEVGLVYREVASAPRPEREQVLEFGGVVTTLADRTSILPIRFGTTVGDVEEARALLRSRGEEWRLRLHDLAGQVEAIVHVRPRDDRPRPAAAGGSPQPGSEPTPESAPVRVTGGDYLRAKVAQHQRQSSEQARVVTVLSPWCRAVRPLPSSEGVRLACLLRADALDDLRSAVEEWADANPDRDVRVTGPFPVFSFAEEDAT